MGIAYQKKDCNVIIKEVHVTCLCSIKKNIWIHSHKIQRFCMLCLNVSKH